MLLFMISVYLALVIASRCIVYHICLFFFFFQAEDGIRDVAVTGVQTCALPISYGIPEDRMSQFAAEFRPVAEAQVRRDLVLDYVVEQQGLQATEAELDRRIQELAERRGMPAEQLYASLEKAKRLRDVERSITEEKVFAFLLSQSTVEHV